MGDDGSGSGCGKRRGERGGERQLQGRHCDGQVEAESVPWVHQIRSDRFESLPCPPLLRLVDADHDRASTLLLAVISALLLLLTVESTKVIVIIY